MSNNTTEPAVTLISFDELNRLDDELDSLKEENLKLRSTMVAAAEEIYEHWSAHCDAEGYGPSNLMRRLETGIGADYPGYYSGAFADLRQQLAAANARIDELMLEYCPDEMTQEQLDNWASHQVTAQEEKS